jgi:hypothetical protein
MQQKSWRTNAKGYSEHMRLTAKLLEDRMREHKEWQDQQNADMWLKVIATNRIGYIERDGKKQEKESSEL